MGNGLIGFSASHLVLAIVVAILGYLFDVFYFYDWFNTIFSLFVAYITASVLLFMYRELGVKKAPEQKVIAFDAGGVYFDGSMLTPHFEPREGFPEFIGELKARGYKVVMFTNQNKTISDMIAERYGLTEVFDAIFSSGEIKIAKPAKEAFAVVLGKLGVKPENFIFVDDAKANVEGAKQLGAKGVVFESLEQLTAEFAKMGVL